MKHPLRAVAFDFDGTLVESAEIKTEAFRDLFSQFPKQVAPIVRYHLNHCGVSRFDKMDHIYRRILRKPLSAAQKNRLCRRFGDLVMERVVTCPYVPGAVAFLNAFHRRVPLYVLSAVPQKELEAILQKRQMTTYFTGVFGAPLDKTIALRRIMREGDIKAHEMVFIGDARADQEAALHTGVAFIGRVHSESQGWRRGTRPRLCSNLNTLNKTLRTLFSVPRKSA